MAGKGPGGGLRAFLLLAVVLGASVHTGYRILQDRVRERLDAALAHLPAGTEVKYGGLRVDILSVDALFSTHPDFRAALERSLTLTDVSIGQGAARCEVGRIAIEGIAGEGSRAEPLHVRSLRFDGGRAAGDMPDCPRRLDARDLVFLTGAAATEVGQRRSVQPPFWPQAGTLLSAGRIETDDIVFVHKQAKMTVGHMVLEDYRDGVVGSAEYRDLRFTETKPVGLAFSHFERLSYRDFALGDTNDVFNPGAYRDDGLPAWTETRRLFGAVEAAGFTFHEEAPGRHSDLAVVGFAARELYGHPFALPARSTAWADRERLQSLGDWRLAQVTAEGVRLDAADASQASVMTLSIDRFTAEGYDKGRLDTVGLHGLGISVAKGNSVELGAVDLHGLDLLPLLTASSEMQEMVLAPHLVPAVTAAFRTAALRVEDVSVLSSDGNKTALAGIEARMSVIDGVAVLQGGLSGLQVPATLPDTTGRSPVLLKALNAAFGPVMTFDTDFDIAWDQTASRLTVRRVDLAGRDLGRLHVDLDLDGRDGELFGTRTKLVRATLRWEDRSLTDRLFALFAHLQNADPASYRAEVIRQVRATPLVLTNQPDSTQQLADFLAAPRALTLTIQPPAPVGFVQIAAMEQWQAVRALNMHLSRD